MLRAAHASRYIEMRKYIVVYVRMIQTLNQTHFIDFRCYFVSIREHWTVWVVAYTLYIHFVVYTMWDSKDFFSSTRTHAICFVSIATSNDAQNVYGRMELKIRYCIKREMKSVNGKTSIRQRTMTWMGKNRCSTCVQYFFVWSALALGEKFAPPANQQMYVRFAKLQVSSLL